MMQEIKIFLGTAKTVENEVNEFLKDKGHEMYDIDIRFQCNENITGVLIFYRINI